MAATALVGIALVSLVGLFTGGASPVPALQLPADVTGAVVLMAPGLESVLASFPEPERVHLQAPWEPLPALDRGYTVVLPNDAPLPRLPLGWHQTSETPSGAWRVVAVTTDEAGGDIDRYDFSEHLSDAQVFFQADDGSVTPCDRWRFGRWACGLEDWLWVGPTEIVARGRNESCLWAHPWAGHDLVIRFPAVPRGTRVMGRYGLSDSAAAVPDGAPVDLTVRAGRAERQLVAANEEGMHTYQLRLEPGASDTVPVELRVRAAQDGRRHFCVSGAMQGIGARLIEGSPAEPGEGTGEMIEGAPSLETAPRALTPLRLSPGMRRVRAAAVEGDAGEGTGERP